MTIEEMEQHKQIVDDKELGLGPLDKEVVNFLIDDDDPLVKISNVLPFEPEGKKKKPKKNSYEYIFEK